MAETGDNRRVSDRFPFTLWIFVMMVMVAASAGVAAAIFPGSRTAIWVSGLVLAVGYSALVRWRLKAEARRLERAVQALPEFGGGSASLPRMNEFADTVQALHGHLAAFATEAGRDPGGPVAVGGPTGLHAGRGGGSGRGRANPVD